VSTADDISVASKVAVLVLEDHPELRHTMCLALEMRGYRAAPASRASRAFDLIERCKGAIDLMITDMMLPGISGLDVAALLERGHPNLPILYISGHSESLAMQSISHQSPQNVLFKPFTMGEMLRRVELLLGAVESG